MDECMADGRSLTRISEADYEAIEAAVMETERGRWFLREFGRRNRNADTQMLLEAITRLEKVVGGARVAHDVDRLRAQLHEMASAIAQTKTEIASIHAVEQEHSRLFAASEALDAITRTTEQATSDILAAAEQIQESAWTLREDGANTNLCDDLDRRATDIYTACSFQDLTAQRTAKVVQTLRYLENRINAMIAVWDARDGALIARPPRSDRAEWSENAVGHDLTQSDIDSVIVDAEILGPSWDQREAAAPRIGDASEPSEKAAPDDFMQSAVDGAIIEAEVLGATSASRDAAPMPSRQHGDLPELSEKAAGDDLSQSNIDIVTIEAEGLGATSDIRDAVPIPRPQDGDPPEFSEKAARGDPTQADIDGVTIEAEEVLGPRTESDSRRDRRALPDLAAAPESRINLQAFAEIDQLSTREKLRLFT
jgi:hypothetical protein